MHYGVIMAGGSGTRLWPLSRSGQPKQLLPVIKGKSLLRLSYDRLREVLPADRIYVCTGAAWGDQVLTNLPEMPKENLLPEPTGRDTANAVGFPAAVLLRKDPDAIMAIVTADHVIEPVDVFAKSLRTGFNIAEQYPEMLVTFGIIPTFGHTGLGYIHRGNALEVGGQTNGSYRVQEFKEKPDKATADHYVDTGRYYWNSGMFVWRCDTVMKELQTHLAASHEGLTKIAEAWGSANQLKVLNEIYPTLPKISIDYAVMEPASKGKGKASVAVVEMKVDWTDVGSWNTLAETFKTDDHDNAIGAERVVYMDADDNIIFSTDPAHLISLVGISDMIIVHTHDATMILPKSDSQRVKDLVAKVKDKFGDKYM